PDGVLGVVIDALTGTSAPASGPCNVYERHIPAGVVERLNQPIELEQVALVQSPMIGVLHVAPVGPAQPHGVQFAGGAFKARFRLALTVGYSPLQFGGLSAV